MVQLLYLLSPFIAVELVSRLDIWERMPLSIPNWIVGVMFLNAWILLWNLIVLALIKIVGIPT